MSLRMRPKRHPQSQSRLSGSCETIRRANVAGNATLHGLSLGGLPISALSSRLIASISA